MMTFQNIYEEVQEQVGDTSAASLVLIKRAINQGAKKFGAVLSREWRNTEKTFSLVASQQFYQLPEDCIRPKSVTVTIGGIAYPLTEVPDEDTWRSLNTDVNTSAIPDYFYVRGNDEIGIWPTPSASIADAGLVNYERRMRDMSAADYTTGSITVANGSADVTGSGTTFTPQMVGRSLKVTDPNGDGMWYKIASYTSATAITLENFYAGIDGNTLNFIIGELPDVPEEYHENIADWGCYRYYLRRKERSLSKEFGKNFEDAIQDCKGNYSSKTTSQYFRPVKVPRGYVHNRRDLMVT